MADVVAEKMSRPNVDRSEERHGSDHDDHGDRRDQA